MSKPAKSMNIRVLSVDDNPAILRVVAGSLGVHGIEVLTAESAAKAMDVLQRHQVDLLILDISMPDISGIEFAREIRGSEKHKHLPIIFFTAMSDEETIREAAAFGNIDYLLKPLRSSVLIDRINKILAAREGNPNWKLPAWNEEVGDATPAKSTLESKIRIPTLSDTTTKLVELLNDTAAVDIGELADLVSSDPGLSSVVLKLVNSPFFGMRRKVTSIKDACVFIGLRDLSSICLSASISQEMKGDDDELVRTVWNHCLTAGLLGRRVAAAVCPANEVDVAMGTLMHGIGIIALLGTPEVEYGELLPKVTSKHKDLLDIEREELKLDHADLGAKVCIELGMNEKVAQMVRDSATVDSVEDVPTWAVAVSTLLPQKYHPGEFRRVADVDAALEALNARFGSSWELLESGIEEVLVEVRECLAQ